MKKTVGTLLIAASATVVPAAFMLTYRLEVSSWEEPDEIITHNNYGFLMTMWCIGAMALCLLSGMGLHKDAKSGR